MSDPIDSERRLGNWLTDLMAGKIVMPSRLHEADEPGQILQSNEWQPIDMGKP